MAVEGKVAVEAITSRRCYKPALPLEHAYAQVEKGAGTHFDPEIVRQFLQIPREDFDRVRERYLEDPGGVIEETARPPQYL